ncbi:MAG TPA: BamA/TamA family outer membrane protein [Kofleriaceae bacterium]|nr:BamA/TamA family outer membrane protein [Kofleriaceae bacterium]
MRKTARLHRPVLLAALTLAGSQSARADRLSDGDLARKNEGGYVTGLPLAAYGTDIGLGGGARVYYYWNGHRRDSLFAWTPYLQRIFFQTFATTRGVQFHYVDYDAPRLFGSPYRLRMQAFYARNINANYFGFGEASLDRLQFPGSSATFDSYSDYTRSQKEVSGDTTWAKYDQFDLIRPAFIGSVERLFAGDRVRVLAGVAVTYAGINDYTGDQVDAVDASGADTMAVMATTRLRADCHAGRLVGCEGGVDNLLRLGISFDTRDFEPDPNSGVFLDAELDLGTVALGSDFDYARAMMAARGYLSPFPRLADLVLAARVVGEVQSSGTPFFEMDTLPFTEDPRTGLGGQRTLRGFRQDRFVGPVMTLANAEVRWTFAHTRLWKQNFAFIATPFVDAGRAFDSTADLTLRRWRASAGAALRISWNLATLVTIDYGVSAEDRGLYINFGHNF